MILWLVAAGACGGTSPNLVAPTPQPLPIPVNSAPFTLSGFVTERTVNGPQPVSGAQVVVFAYNEGGLFPVDPDAVIASTQTGPDGHYSLQGTLQVSWIGANKNGYREYDARCCDSRAGAVVYNIDLLSK